VAEFVKGRDKGWLEPFGGTDFALEGENACLRPVGITRGAEFVDQANGFIDVLGVGVALLHEAHGDAVSAEDQMDERSVGKLAETFADVLNKGLNVERMVVETFDGALRKRVDGFAVDAAPLLEAAESGGERIVRIEREENEFIETSGALEASDGFFRERLPVTHRGDGDGIDVRLDGFDEAHALALRENADGRAATNHAIALRDGDAAFFGDIAGERATDEVERAEGDDVGITEEIAKEGLDIGERVGAAELEEDDADAFFGVGGHGITSHKL
jgi:hypothetical protein